MKIAIAYHDIEEIIRKHSIEDGILFVSRTSARIEKIRRLASNKGLKVRKVAKPELDSLAEGQENRGILLQYSVDIAEEKETTLDSFLKKNKKDKSVVVVLDSVTDPHNVGAILRSCDLFAVDLMILPSRRSAKDSDVIARVSSGANNWIPVCVVNNLSRAIEKLQDNEYWVYGADMNGESISDADVADKAVLVMGSEGKGIGKNLKSKCDKILSINTSGHIDSLNVSVAAGIFLYEFHKR